MDINAEACIKQGEELGMIAKKKSIEYFKRRLQHESRPIKQY